MRTVAGCTRLVTIERTVGLVAEKILLQSCVTLKTERPLGGAESGRRPLVAVAAPPAGKRRMDAPVRSGALDVPVRIVAAEAIGPLHGDSAVPGEESRLLWIVAIRAQSGHRVLQHRVLGRAVGIMAGIAFPLGDRLVGDSLLHDGANVLVATYA
jgi:hypothetical protein